MAALNLAGSKKYIGREVVVCRIHASSEVLVAVFRFAVTVFDYDLCVSPESKEKLKYSF
ncbi:hypothetical protein D3C76_750190 [compost metagenome]